MNFSRLIKTESYTKGMALSVLFNIISKGILFLLTIIIARYFGSDIKTDIYFFVFATMIFFSSFINNIDTAVLIPEAMRLREKEGEGKAMGFLNYFLFIYFAIGILFTVMMYFFGTAIFGWISKFSEADIIAYDDYFWLGSFFFIFHVLTNYLNNVLTSLKYFSLPMIISSVKSCIVIVCIFLLKADYDVLSVILGGLISYAINLLIQLYILYAIAGWKFSFAIKPIRKKIWSNVLYAELGQAATVASSMFPLYLLSGFGSGVISVMNYGKNIADIPNTLITSQFANVSGIQLNEQASRDDYAGMNETFLNISKLMVFILVPLGCFMFVFAEPVVELFYKYGSFTQQDVTGSAKFMKLLSVTVFSIGVNAMVSRLFMAAQFIRQAIVYQVVMNILMIVFVWLFSRQVGAYGYPYGIILANIVNFLGMFFICKKYFSFIKYGELLKYTGTVFLINIPVALILIYTLQQSILLYFYKLLAGVIIYLGVFLATARIKKIN
ncbi:MAG: oligosaccharide flippase family protein [Ferruginibacter sp.]|nr:oligosaccharide flippase family protein [Ferruginibacter sp.]